MKRLVRLKPSRPLGEKIGPVRIIEQVGKSANDGHELRYFAIFSARGGLRITFAGAWTWPSAIATRILFQLWALNG